MSLLKKASIITTPTAYAEDYLYSIKPAYALGSELVTNGGFESSASWTVSGTDSTHIATFSNGTLRYQSDTTSPQLIVAQASVLQTGRLYKITVNVTTLTSGYVKVDSLGGLNITPSAGTNIFYKTATGTTFNITRGTTNVDVTIDSISVVEVTDADFDFDRNSTGTRVNEDYLIEDVPYNLASYSEDFSNSGWIKINVNVTSNQILAPDGTLSADKLIATSGASNKVIYQAISAGTYTASVFAKKGEFEGLFIGTGTVGAFFNLNTYAYRTHYTSTPTSHKIESYGDGWYRYSITFTESGNNNLYIAPNDNVSTTLAITGDGSKGIYIWGGQLVKSDQPKDYLKTTDRLDIPRIDYTNGEPSILLEPSRTNLFEYDIDFSQSVWTKGNVTLQSNTAISPEGLQNASNIYPTTNVAYIYNTTTASSSVYTVSAYVKANGKNVAWLYSNSGSTNGTIYFDLSDESMQVVAGSAGTPTGTITKMPNGWYRITFTTGTAISLTGGSGVGVSDAKGSLNATQNGTDGILVYGLQIEAGSYATSLIHTSGSAVTRSADAANNAGNSDLINSTEGVLYVEASSNYDSSHTNRIAISDGTSSNRISLEWDETTENRIRLHINTHSLLSYDAVDLSIQNKVAVKYAANDYAIWFNGREVVTQASGALPTGMDVLEFTGAGLGSAGSFYGNAKSVMVFKEALTDLELEKLTGYNNHELYMNYYNRLSYLGLAEEYNVESDINNYIL
jgi:hypothetical protein